MLLRQRRAGDRTGIVVEAHHRIELVLRRGGIAQCTRHVAGIAGEIIGEATIALRLRPNRLWPDLTAVHVIVARRAPTDGPRLSAGAGIGVGGNHAIGAQPRAAFEPLDQRDSRRSYRLGRRLGGGGCVPLRSSLLAVQLRWDNLSGLRELAQVADEGEERVIGMIWHGNRPPVGAGIAARPGN
jgi:hypothetical protein